jgi:ABC-2 type transport system ATP-binding protein
MALIRTEGLVKRYGAVAAHAGLTLEVEPGVIGLIGANGSGKSTLIKLLLGLIDATDGRAEVLEFDAARDPLRGGGPLNCAGSPTSVRASTASST